MRVSLLAIATSLALGACTFAASPEGGAEVEAPAPVTLTVSGNAQTLTPEPDEENMQWAAAVTEVVFLENQGEGPGVKLFGLAGGDPAMNGLYTQIAFFESPGSDWRVFRIGDFISYRVLSDAPGRVDLEISESTMNPETSEIGSQTRHLIVTWTRGPDGAAPDAIEVAPANVN
jgi:hypothetical protein